MITILCSRCSLYPQATPPHCSNSPFIKGRGARKAAPSSSAWDDDDKADVDALISHTAAISLSPTSSGERKEHSREERSNEQLREEQKRDVQTGKNQKDGSLSPRKATPTPTKATTRADPHDGEFTPQQMRKKLKALRKKARQIDALDKKVRRACGLTAS